MISTGLKFEGSTIAITAFIQHHEIQGSVWTGADTAGCVVAVRWAAAGDGGWPDGERGWLK